MQKIGFILYNFNECIHFQVVQKQPAKPKEDENLRKEVDILQQLNHPNIVQCLDFFEDDKTFHVVMEFLQVGVV